MHFRRVERHDRFAGGQKPPSKVAASFGHGVIDSGGHGPPRGPRKTFARPVSVLGSRVSVRLTGTVASAGRLRMLGVSGIRGRLGVGGESVGHLSDPS